MVRERRELSSLTANHDTGNDDILGRYHAAGFEELNSDISILDDTSEQQEEDAYNTPYEDDSEVSFPLYLHSFIIIDISVIGKQYDYRLINSGAEPPGHELNNIVLHHYSNPPLTDRRATPPPKDIPGCRISSTAADIWGYVKLPKDEVFLPNIVSDI